MDTIVAIATALAKSAISIVRLSGKDSVRIACQLCSSHNFQYDSTQNPFSPRKATLRCIYDDKGRMLDKAIILYFQAPFSYNGEDIIEIQSHGGLLIAQEILKTCLAFGARLAHAGEFSKRAFYNGKLDLIALQATISLINNTNTNLTQLLVRNLNGECMNMLESVRLEILEIIAQIEVSIDYSEEDLDPALLEKSLQTLHKIMQRFQSILESTKHYNRLQNTKLCILGKPNVGKSSLLNLLLLRNRAIVSPIAGTTRDTITEIIDIDGNLISIADTAGIRKSDDMLETEGIQRSFAYAKECEILLCMFDLSSEMTNEDREILDFIQSDSMQNKSLLVILNKDDLERKNTHDFSAFHTLTFNTKELTNHQKLKDKIKEFLSMNIESDTLILTSTMQATLLESTLAHLQDATRLLESHELELTSYELTQSLKDLGQMTKPYDTEEVLDSLFTQFCVGK